MLSQTYHSRFLFSSRHLLILALQHPAVCISTLPFTSPCCLSPPHFSQVNIHVVMSDDVYILSWHPNSHCALWVSFKTGRSFWLFRAESDFVWWDYSFFLVEFWVFLRSPSFTGIVCFCHILNLFLNAWSEQAFCGTACVCFPQILPPGPRSSDWLLPTCCTVTLLWDFLIASMFWSPCHPCSWFTLLFC